jgi:hypothetical protein
MIYPLNVSVDVLYKRLSVVLNELGPQELILQEVLDWPHGRKILADRYHDFEAALAELARQEKVRILPNGRLTVTPNFPIPPQTLQIPVIPSLAEIIKRHHSNAQSMVSAYVTLYAIENSLRDYIATKLSSSASDWWETMIPSEVRRQSKTNFENDAKKLVYGDNRSWEDIAAIEKLSFATFGLLSNIIVANWSVFESEFKDQRGVSGRLAELEPLRNAIAHARMLSQKERGLLETFSQNILDAIRST